jgi:hypothetical protein
MGRKQPWAGWLVVGLLSTVALSYFLEAIKLIQI